jgi:hypothetical protein
LPFLSLKSPVSDAEDSEDEALEDEALEDDELADEDSEDEAFAEDAELLTLDEAVLDEPHPASAETAKNEHTINPKILFFIKSPPL